ncbi:hypothetical protein CBL_05436 [Carabus blaptoides fortunei]
MRLRLWLTPLVHPSGLISTRYARYTMPEASNSSRDVHTHYPTSQRSNGLISQVTGKDLVIVLTSNRAPCTTVIECHNEITNEKSTSVRFRDGVRLRGDVTLTSFAISYSLSREQHDRSGDGSSLINDPDSLLNKPLGFVTL